MHKYRVTEKRQIPFIYDSSLSNAWAMRWRQARQRIKALNHEQNKDKIRLHLNSLQRYQFRLISETNCEVATVSLNTFKLNLDCKAFTSIFLENLQIYLYLD